MKAKIVYLALALALVFSLAAVAVVPAGPALAADLHVGSGQTYATIQAAIAVAGSGDTIIVHAGTYEPTELPAPTYANLVIASGVTLELLPGVTVKFAWNIVGGNYYGNGFVVQDGGTFHAEGDASRNIKICKQDGAEWGGYLVRFEAGSSGYVKNCTIQSGLEHIQLWGASGITIENNFMSLSSSFMINLYEADGNTIKDNILLGTPQANIGLTGSNDNIVIGNKLYPYAYAQNNGIDVCTGSYRNQILNNMVTGVDPYGYGGTMSRGICINVGSHYTTVQGNEIYGVTYHGISLFGTSTNTVITGNDIHDNGKTGIILEAGGATGVAINFNNICDNVAYGVKVDYDAAPVDATNNWWGSANGPGQDGANGIYDLHSDVDYTPWLGEAYAPTKSTGTATATGDAFFSPDSGALEALTPVAEASLPALAQATKPINFPDGLFSFNIVGLGLGDTVVVTITLPPGATPTQYWKYHPNTQGGWVQIPMAIVGPPNVITITLQDGGVGDDDGVADGTIVDDGGPGSPAPEPTPTPTPTPEEEGGCFIATAAYGTSTAAEIDVLRAFRDGVLLQSSLGSQLVALYYDVSPPVADFISGNSFLKTLVRELVIDPMVSVATFTQGIWGK